MTERLPRRPEVYNLAIEDRGLGVHIEEVQTVDVQADLNIVAAARGGARIDAGDRLLPALVSRSPAGFVRVEPSGVLTLAGGAYFVACALSGRGGVGSAVLELLPYDGENALDFARARAGLIPPDAFGALSYSFVLETRGEAALSFAPSVDDGQPLTDYAFSLALLRLR